MITLIGDVHGKVDKYKEITQSRKYTVCLGDFGFANEWNWLLRNIDPNHHKVLGGNHDDYNWISLNDCPHYLGDYGFTVVNNAHLFFIRGAYSVDKASRVYGINWFEQEELNHQEGANCISLFEQTKPEIVISHDCPFSVKRKMHTNGCKSSLTNSLLEFCFQTHQPKLWIFGHHHRSFNIHLNSTGFTCLNELETKNV